MWHRASNLEAALAMAERMRTSGHATWFRGQTRNWPVLSSFVRKEPADRKVAIERFGLFQSWIRSVSALAEIARDEDALLAVAQHYGLATNLVDFSTEPKVAAFFAAQSPGPRPSDDEDVSCIICVDYDELKDVCDSVRIVRPDMPDPRAVTVRIGELWRIQAQHGVFLEYPFDVGFERHTFAFDRIIFPTERDPATLATLIPIEEIYPTQKSELEIHLDQFFMIEKMAQGTKAIHDMAAAGRISLHVQQPVPDGIEAECFGRTGLPVHDSWDPTRLNDWLRVDDENWKPVSAAPNVSIQYPRDGGPSEKIELLRGQILDVLTESRSLRTGPVKWTVLEAPANATRAVRAMELVWDGLRRWPYDSLEIAQALGMVIEFSVLVAQQPAARHTPALAEALAARCLGGVIEVEIGMEDSSYTRGYANTELLRQAVRDDFSSYLTDRWRPQIKGIRHILQIAFNPRRTLVFERLRAVFCTQIVPTQVVLRDEGSGKARLYNPARATALGLP